MSGLHEVPMYQLESRQRIRKNPEAWGVWQLVLQNGLLSHDDLQGFKDELGRVTIKNIEYRAVQHSMFGTDVQPLHPNT